MTAEIAAPKPDLDAKAKKERFWILNHFWKGMSKGKAQAEKLRKSADKSLSVTIATLMLPLEYNSRLSAAKDSGITQAAAATRNLDAAITVQAVETELQNAIEQGFVLRLPAQNQPRATCMQPLRFAAWRGKRVCIYAHGSRRLPLRSATADSKPPYNNAAKAAWSHCYTTAQRKNVRTTSAAPAAHTSCPSSPATVTWRGKTQ